MSSSSLYFFKTLRRRILFENFRKRKISQHKEFSFLKRSKKKKNVEDFDKKEKNKGKKCPFV